MRYTAMAISTVCLLACSPNDSGRRPTAPVLADPPVQPSGSLARVWAMAVDASGVCIPGASATVVRGQGQGQGMVQVTPCGAWDYHGGFMFQHLTPGVAMTIRVSASGYASREQTVVPSLAPSTAVVFALARVP